MVLLISLVTLRHWVFVRISYKCPVSIPSSIIWFVVIRSRFGEQIRWWTCLWAFIIIPYLQRWQSDIWGQNPTWNTSTMSQQEKGTIKAISFIEGELRRVKKNLSPYLNYCLNLSLIRFIYIYVFILIL